MAKQSGLILTVGTGTAGKYSNLAAGLIATIQKIQPRRYWLIPSAAPDSIATAELIRESCPDEFTRADENADFFTITRHDDIFDCRTVIRRAIATAKQQLNPNEQLLVNPTSGTKQMSAGATLAALDEEIGTLIFTVGERADGVVKTGTERLTAFNTRDFFIERDLRSANLLYQSGAFAAAAKLLEAHQGDAKSDRARKQALCMHEWQRLNYEKAASYAAVLNSQLAEHLQHLAADVKSELFSLRILADILRGADALSRWNDLEEAVIRYYKALEYAARMRLINQAGTTSPLNISALNKLPLPKKLMDELRPHMDGMVSPSLSWTLQALESMGDPFAAACRQDNALRRKLRTRNEAMHEIRPVLTNEAQSFCERLNNLFLQTIPDLNAVRQQAPPPPETLLPP